MVSARLVTLLEDPSPDVRRTAALSLGKIGDAGAGPALARAVSDPDPVVREYGAWALGQIGDEIDDAAALRLVGALGDAHQDVNAAAARALGNVGFRQPMLAVLTDFLDVGTRNNRRAVVDALAQLEVPAAYAALVTALTDRDPAVRQGALAALGELADRRALTAFRHRLRRDADAGVRAEAAYRIGKLGDVGAVSDLEWAAAHDATPVVRAWAAWAGHEIVGERG